MRAAIVTTIVSLAAAVFSTSAFADDYASATARCAKENPGEFAAQMSCIQQERSEPSRLEQAAPERPAQVHSVTKRFDREREFSDPTVEN